MVNVQQSIFFNLEKSNYNRKTISELCLQDDSITRNETVILEQIENDYSSLYTSSFSHLKFHFSHLKTWNFTSGWVKNRVKRETGDSCVVTCHREHIDNQNKREVRDCRDGTHQQPGNFSLFLHQSSLSVNNKMPSYQATVELDSKSGEQRFWQIGDGEGDCQVWYWKGNSRGINAFDSELEGLYLDEPLADDNWIAKYSSEV